MRTFPKRTYFELDYYELEQLATKVYSLIDYEFVAVQECGNDTKHSFNVDGKITNDWDQKHAEIILNTKEVPCWNNRLLLQMLCRDGHIEPGEYLVSVSW